MSSNACVQTQVSLSKAPHHYQPSEVQLYNRIWLLCVFCITHTLYLNTHKKKNKIYSLIWLIVMLAWMRVLCVYLETTKRTTPPLRTLITMTTTTPVSEAKAKAGKRRTKWTETDGWTRIDGTKLWKLTKIHVGQGAAKTISTLENENK